MAGAFLLGSQGPRRGIKRVNHSDRVTQQLPDFCDLHTLMADSSACFFDPAPHAMPQA
jgi:hypothetical protein